jgi:dihydrodipicolinate synthase/N-acetylneuraminate lyase
VPAIKTRTKRVGFQILTGRTTSLLESLAAGAPGVILPFAACAPQAVYEVLAAWKDGNPDLAAEKGNRLLAAAQAIEEQLGAAAIKSACDLNGYFGGKPRLPLLPLSGEQRSRIETLMSGMRN